MRFTGIIGIAVWLVVASCASPDVPKHKVDLFYTDAAETIEGNPGRGAATRGPWVIFQPEGLPDWHGEAGFHSSLWELSRFSAGHRYNGQTPPADRVGTADLPLTEAMKADVARFLQETRALGGTLIVRLGYTWTDALGCEPSDFNLMLEHIRDLSQLMADYDDVIIGVEAGIIGPWGEMHSSDYDKPEYVMPILQTYLDILPEDISLLVRAPRFLCMMTEKDAEGTLAMLPFSDSKLRRIGMFNDGYLGTREDYGTWAADFTRERGCRFLSACEEHPYGGEIAHVDRQWITDHYEIFNPQQWNLIRELYQTHLSYLRNIHLKGHVISDFLDEELVFDTLAYAYEGMPDLSEYQGKSIGKLMLDHMGYRYVIRDLQCPTRFVSGSKSRITMVLENTGFGRMPLPTQAALLIVTDDTETKIPLELPLTMGGGERDTLTMEFELPSLPATDSGRILLRVWAPIKGNPTDTLSTRLVRFANQGMWSEKYKANDLGIIRIE